MENQNYVISREIASKFEFYFLALVFTILGLSVQTTAFVTYYNQGFFEIIALSSFLVSGLAGLSRIEWSSVFYRYHGSIKDAEEILNKCEQGKQGKIILLKTPIGDQWKMEELSSEIDTIKKKISLQKESAEDIEKKNLLKYGIHKWSFYVGLVSLVISRAIIGLTRL